MSLLGKLVGSPLGSLLDDKAERLLAKGIGEAATIFALLAGTALIVWAW